ncbi:60S ribosomal protein L35, putative [Entamoeba invadens IP1]|uniref:60S ribosomal protein L35, putative n=1 Tax=Entamoeba invadens IP1 TaxID=370355 RepID=A0A0A1UHE1_ENTIV|nr:60S ribosomal protein L35, putative [Entamoeba invadens IP1]ELP95162.1 60S ribosomal protein L35, putative [Entamoeba invadens IP1]|eukprot:XP_004261933.1 60S ribosomal protein L35, putative [Entamoeba invadens IP1]
MNKTDLAAKLVELKTEYANLRTAKVTGGQPAKLSKLRVVRRNIARLLTFMNTQRKNQLRVYYKQSKYIPKELRPRTTKKQRLALTPEQKNAKTKKQAQKAAMFPMRRFFIRA